MWKHDKKLKKMGLIVFTFHCRYNNQFSTLTWFVQQIWLFTACITSNYIITPVGGDKGLSLRESLNNTFSWFVENTDLLRNKTNNCLFVFLNWKFASFLHFLKDASNVSFVSSNHPQSFLHIPIHEKELKKIAYKFQKMYI